MSKDQLDHVNLENEGFRGHYFRSDAAIHNLGIRMGRRYPCLDEFPVKTFWCRPHGQHFVVLAENTNNEGDRNDPCPIVSRAHNDPCPIGSRSQQIYSQKMMSLSTLVKRGNESPGMLRRQFFEEEDHAFELERRHLTRLKMENSSYFDYAMDGLKLLERLGCLLDTLETGSGSDYKAKKKTHQRRV
ncbi:hypothetical protein K2173_015451 [Erythroxylum novogranatense]|uniref:Uncharacterized protein n=1 Tax=Erythroxylum novogranatense TaxID=1862640 RepID=A0AAV8SSF5_9ROSI|nr:hypothetical protein K2173_015451 [Erythroxylum novogranatense]